MQLKNYLKLFLFYIKYITYAKRNCNPVISEEAANVLRSFYLYLRKTYKKRNCNPITMRQLESLIRLTQVLAIFAAYFLLY